MNKEEREELREIVESCSSTIMAKVDGQYGIISTKLDGINNHLKDLNGSVARHERTINEAIEERAKNRQEQREYFNDIKEIKPRLRTLEDNQLSSLSIKKWIIGTIAVTGTLIGIVTTIIKFITES